MNIQSTKRFTAPLLAGVGYCLAPLASAGIEDLWITEVVPSTQQVEVTNVGSEPFTTPNQMAFCHGFRYGNRIPAGEEFAPGESKVFSLSLANTAASDLWIYRGTSGFGSTANLLNGLKWGSASSLGRTGVAVNGGKWDATASFAPAAAAGEAIKLVGPDPFSAEHWAVGVPDLGQFSMPEPLELSFLQVGDVFEFTWSGGTPPYRLETSTDLENWESAGDLTADTAASVDITDEPRRFYRVVSMASPDPTATFRATFVSNWSNLAFANVPGNAHFSALVGATHSDGVSFWQPGGISSPGVEVVAESGETGTMQNEIQSAINAGTAANLLTAAGVDDELGMSSFEFTADLANPLLTLLTMLAPTPDWFTGVHDYDLLAGENGDWLQSVQIPLRPYDAGTDSGTDFTSPNSDTNPQEPIFSLENDANFLPSLLIGIGADPVPLAGLLLERID